ncbi:rhamnulokinase [Rhodopirellula sp. MGV]|uniref:rhamnulokinase n=1 Tax=Rhodopirellula sp. MGV TaxID=2023130 RepID=UPI000B9779A8|nr:rhamnulokinase family protein [Rhodopirellula sp. MGV]OYP36544.1 rhamnulokinase [Rhodopirellula sp. MGV]PNY34521.1 rhamnulokinase [Rhodopirellula baltica]
MIHSPVHLAVDLGASSGRVIAGWLDDGALTLEEVHRFVNEPVLMQDSLQWNVHALWAEILEGLRKAAIKYDVVRSVGVDTWGVDYVLLDSNDQLVGPVRNYRDSRTHGMLARACERLGGADVGRAKIFEATGLQFMEINTVYQLFAAAELKERSLEIADHFLMMGDFFHWLLSGKRSIEATNASTTQMVDPSTGRWQIELLKELGIPGRLFEPTVQPGTVLGNIQPSVAEATGLDDVPVVVPATHDTGSAVISVPVDDFAPEKPDWCYISSGTWSLMGCELATPRVNNLCSELNFTNEGGVAGSTRLLKNIGGLWIFQQLRKSMQRQGEDVSWEQMVRQASQATAFELLIDPDSQDFVAPHDMLSAIKQYAETTGQPIPETDGGYYRAALEGLALRYRVCLGMLEQLVENRIETIHIVGGGTMNELLCQMTADACDRTVVAGPVEATAIGNLVMQMIGTDVIQGDGELSSAIRSARGIVRESFEVKTYRPHQPRNWDEPAERFLALSAQGASVE